MGRGWWRVAALGVAASVFLGLAADFARPAAQEAVPEGRFSLLGEKGRAVALGLIVVGSSALRAYANAGDGVVDSPFGGDGSSAAAVDGAPAPLVTESVLVSLFVHPPFEAADPPPSWPLLAGVAVLLVVAASLSLHRRPAVSTRRTVPEDDGAAFLFAATSRGPLFRQPVVYASTYPNNVDGGRGAWSAPHLGPRGVFQMARGLQGLLEVPERTPSGEDAWVLPFGEPAA